MNHRPVLSAGQVNKRLVVAGFKRKRKTKLLRSTLEYINPMIANSYIDEWISAGFPKEAGKNKRKHFKV